MTIDRREFLKTAAAVGVAASLAPASLSWAADSAPGSFDFVFFTDTHIQPELDAAHGCDLCFRKIAKLKPDFAIMGGDHVFDAFGVNAIRARLVFDMYARAEQLIGMPLHNAIGNNDVFAVSPKTGVV